jgi:hypothetical protein
MIICHSVQEAKTSIAGRLWIGYENAMHDPDDTGDHANDVARRLRLVRTALGIPDQRDFGEAANLEQSLYNRFETGKRLLTLQAATKLTRPQNTPAMAVRHVLRARQFSPAMTFYHF